LNTKGGPIKFAVGRKKTGGRAPGTPNKTVAEIKALCLKSAPTMVAELERLALHGKQEQTRVAAMRELLDRGLGRPSQAHTVEGGLVHSFQVITHAQFFEGDSAGAASVPALPSVPALNGFADGDA
jgi:hypothetical protein